MAISINWPTGVIFVPKADLTLIQASPEIRGLDLNAFRLELKDLEDSDAGMPFPKTHNHNTEVLLSGIVYARIISVIPPYTVEFEDGQYAVSCTGANHNLADVKVANQVSLLVNNAAGLISNQAIEYSSFNSMILVDQINGAIGTLFPKGTIQAPVLLLSDAKIISDSRGIKHIKFIGDGLITTGDTFQGYVFEGFSPTLSTLTIDSAAVVTNSEFRNCKVTGTLDGGSTLRYCEVNSLSYVNGDIYDSIINSGTITLGGNSHANFLNCASGVATPIIDCGGSGQSLAMRNYNGGVKLTNKTGADFISIDLNSGQVILDTATVTAGLIVVRGVGKLVDELGAHIFTGTWNGVTIVNETVNSSTIGGGSLTLSDIADAVWDEVLTGATHNIPSSAGRRLRQLNALSQIDGTIVDATATTISFKTNLTQVDNFFNDSMLVFTSGILTGQARAISDYSLTNGLITLDEALTSAPINGVTFTIVAIHVHPTSQIADAVWDGAMSEHTIPGSLADELKKKLSQNNFIALK